MPRIVDAEARRAQIVLASMKILGEGGFVKLTLSNLAKELGGSMRLVTHYFSDRQDLILAVLNEGLAEVDDLSAELESVEGEHQRLKHVLTWFLPLDEHSLLMERARVALVVHKDVEPVIGEFFSSVEIAMRRVLRHAVEPLVDEDEVEGLVHILRAWTSGMALASVEHPEIWTPERQLSVLDEFLARFSLTWPSGD